MLAFPHNINLVFDGEAQKILETYAGFLIVQEKRINGKFHWVHKSRTCALWWDKVCKSWVLGKLSDIGSMRARIKGPSNNDVAYPKQMVDKWKYWNNKNECGVELNDYWNSKKG